MKISNRYVSIVVLATFGLALGVAWVRTRYVGQVVVMDTKASIEPTAEGLSGSKQSAGEVGIRGHSSKSSNPRDLYLGDGISLGDRFDKLASQAGNGNLDAKQFVLQIAASCRSWAGLSEDKRAVAKLKPAAAQALEQLSSMQECFIVTRLRRSDAHTGLKSFGCFRSGCAPSHRKAVCRARRPKCTDGIGECVESPAK